MNIMMSIDSKKIYFSLVSATAANGAVMEMLAAGRISSVEQLEYYEAYLDFVDCCKEPMDGITFHCEYYRFGEEEYTNQEVDPLLLYQMANSWWLYSQDPQMYLLEEFDFGGKPAA